MTAVVAEPLFDRAGWWDPTCRAFASLRSVNAFRLALLREWLPGFCRGTVVDLGCGGGLLAVPLAAAGARVVAVDLGRSAVREAAAHGGGGVQAVVGDIAQCPVVSGQADLVLLADVLEHVADPAPVVAEAARLLRPGGHLFVNTIARTLKARLLAIALGEGLGFIPRGTHRHDWFVAPAELERAANDAGLVRQLRCGERVAVVPTLWSRAVVLRKTRSLAVGYAVLYRKRER